MRNNVEFQNLFRAFICQAVRGVYTSHIMLDRLDQLTISSALYYYVIIYLNGCWHNYNKNIDLELMHTMNNILQCQIIRGTVCLFNWIQNIGTILIKSIDIDIFKTLISYVSGIDNKRQFVQTIIEQRFDLYFSDTIAKINCIGDDCKTSYDGKDLFKFSITGIDHS